MKKKGLISLLLTFIMCFSLCVPAFAAPAETELPPWVEEGEQWFPANGIMPLEDFGNCPKGHTGPSGYTYEGYTMGQSTGNYDEAALALTVASIATANPIVVKASSLASAFLSYLAGNENPNIHI